MAYGASKKVSIKVPQTKPGARVGVRGSKKSLTLKPAKGMSGNRRPTLGEQVPQRSPGPN